MLENLTNIINGLKSLDVNAEITAIVERNGSEIVKLQQEQLAAGIDKDGQPRIDEYRPLTKFIKMSQGQGLGSVIDRVTFYMHGNLYNSMRNEIMGKVFQVKSPLPTYDKMIERIGEENYGLDAESLQEFRTDITLPAFLAYVNQKTGLNLR